MPSLLPDPSESARRLTGTSERTQRFVDCGSWTSDEVGLRCETLQGRNVFHGLGHQSKLGSISTLQYPTDWWRIRTVNRQSMIKSRLSRPRSWSPGDVERQPQITSAKHRRRGPRRGRERGPRMEGPPPRHRWAPRHRGWTFGPTTVAPVKPQHSLARASAGSGSPRPWRGCNAVVQSCQVPLLSEA